MAIENRPKAFTISNYKHQAGTMGETLLTPPLDRTFRQPIEDDLAALSSHSDDDSDDGGLAFRDERDTSRHRRLSEIDYQHFRRTELAKEIVA